jgi:thiopeptide-type bacteriocin biosynthesis protein
MHYEYYPSLIVRLPVLSLSNLLKTEPYDFVKDPKFKEALYLASPDVARMVYEENVPVKGNLALTLNKYFNRMCFRCTPFGLFAGCTVADWGQETVLNINTNQVRRRSRPDKAFLSALLQQLNQTSSILRDLSVRTNNTLYRLGKEYRLIERGSSDGEFNITAIIADEVLENIIGLLGVDWTDVNTLMAESKKLGFRKRETLTYLRQLLANQVVSTNLDLALPNNALIDHWISQLSGHDFQQNSKANRRLNWLKRFSTQLEGMDKAGNFNPKALAELYRLAAETDLDPAENRIFQVDCSFKEANCTIGYAVQKQLNKGIDILKKISTLNREDKELDVFRQRFLKKYEQQEVPLLLALDPETGIDYLEGAVSFDNFLSREIAMPAQATNNTADLNFNLKLILKKYEDALASGLRVIDLTDGDLQQMEEYERVFPVTTSVFFKIIGANRLQINSVSGSSGMNLFARFTHFDESLQRIAQELTQLEQRMSGDTILAELIHEPEPRAGNVLPHWSYRDYDISYYANSAKPQEQQIGLNDLLLSVQGGRFILRSKRLNKLVKPMISSAYNYRKGSPIYRFLGALQQQGLDQLQFDFESILPGKSFYPRLVYQNIVFSVAKWKLSFTELREMTIETANGMDLADLRHALDRKAIPQLFIMSEGDHELLIDTKQDTLLAVFSDQLRKRKVLLIKEFLWDDSTYPVINASGHPLNNQMIAILLSRSSQHSELIRPFADAMAPLQRAFTLGSEWLYYKLYSGVISSDKLLSHTVPDLLLQLKRRKLIDHAFFIRYNDPDPHIRLRLHLRCLDDLQAVIEAVRSALLEVEKSGQIWKTQTDTYQRELERYGAAMESSERVFYYDSMAVLQLLSIPLIFDDPAMRLAAGIRLCKDLLDSYLTEIPSQLSFIASVKSRLKTDIGLDTEAGKMINKSYRGNAKTYLRFLESTPPRLERIFQARIKGILRVMSGPVAMHLLESHIHMSVNRLFPGQQKAYEYIIYDYLSKYLNRVAQGF